MDDFIVEQDLLIDQKHLTINYPGLKPGAIYIQKAMPYANIIAHLGF